MRYYSLVRLTRLDVIGTFPQIKEIKEAVKDTDKFGYLSTLKDEELPNMDSFLLDSGAALTDSLTVRFFSVLNGFLISNQAKNLFWAFTLSNTSFFSATVYSEDDIGHDYYYMRIKPSIGIYDYKHSVFEIKSELLNLSDGEVEINTSSDLEKVNEVLAKEGSKGKTIVPTKLVLTEAFDLFRFPYNPYIIISQRVKDKIEASRLVGFAFKDLKWEIINQ